MAAEDRHMEFWKACTASQERFDYFLMALAVAAIGFALQRTAGLSVEWSMTPLAGAILLWGLSVFGGLRRQERVDVSGHTQYKLMIGVVPEHHIAEANKLLEEESNKAIFWRRVQFYTFLLGVAFFLTWHVCEMVTKGE